MTVDDGVLDVGDDFRRKHPDLKSVLAAGEVELLRAAASASQAIPLSDLSLLSPIPNPDKIICIGLNYMSHIKETGREAPKWPSIFTRYPSSVVGHGQEMIRPKVSDAFDYEGELAVIIGKKGRNISAADAMSHVAGYSCFNDGSIRDYQRHTSQFWAGKNFDRSGAMGPALVTVDESPRLEDMKLQTRLNGETVQSVPVSDLAFGIPELIAYISSVTELLPGDVIATGTPSGVGLFREPNLFMKPGDEIEVEISGLGTLANTIADER